MSAGPFLRPSEVDIYRPPSDTINFFPIARTVPTAQVAWRRRSASSNGMTWAVPTHRSNGDPRSRAWLHEG